MFPSSLCLTPPRRSTPPERFVMRLMRTPPYQRWLVSSALHPHLPPPTQQHKKESLDNVGERCAFISTGMPTTCLLYFCLFLFFLRSLPLTYQSFQPVVVEGGTVRAMKDFHEGKVWGYLCRFPAPHLSVRASERASLPVSSPVFNWLSPREQLTRNLKKGPDCCSAGYFFFFFDGGVGRNFMCATLKDNGLNNGCVQDSRSKVRHLSVFHQLQCRLRRKPIRMGGHLDDWVGIRQPRTMWIKRSVARR